MTDINEKFTAEIGEMNTLGNGIVKRDGCVVFCLGACDGDTVTASITEHKKNFAIAGVDSIIKRSPYRTEPDCPVYDKCGGCTLRHITYQHEAEIKRQSVLSALRRSGVGAVTVPEIITSSPDRYRNKAVFRFDSEGHPGFSGEKSDSIIPAKDCLLCPEIFSEIAAFCGSILAVDISSVSFLFLRTNSDGSEICAMLGTNPGKAPDTELFAEKLKEKFPNVTSIFKKEALHPEDYSVPAVHVSGAKFINESFAGLRLVISPLSFFQVNYNAAQLLIKKVCEFVGDGGYGADLYCGTGIIGMSVAKNVPNTHITGVEINESAVEDARRNAALNSLSNIGFFCADSADFAKSIYGALDFVIIDPPRSGCSDKMIKELLHICSSRIVYVSCDPGTLGRDIKKLSEKYTVRDIAACDLFPRTRHVETVVLLENTNKR